MTSITTTAPLASSNHSGRLRYASAKELPSFPSTGLKNDGTAASAAATLGWANQKSPGLWKPVNASESASAAALLANDKMAPASDPQRAQSAAGSQAAIIAASSARRRENNQSSPPSLWGSSAANQAFKASKSSQQQSSPTLGTTALTRQGSMHAAKGAMAGTLRPRAISSPVPATLSYPDKANAASNALTAATIAHRPSMRTMNIPIQEAGAVPFTTMDRQMFTSNPPVKPETDEQKRNDVLYASALAMAKRMYNQQQQQQQQKASKDVETRARASSFSRHGEGDSHGLTEEEPIPIVSGNLQEAAYRLAQERLAKLQDQHQKNRDFQQYYGATKPQPPSKFGSIRNKLTRRRSSSDGDLIMEDQMRSRQIRNQMSLFNTKLQEVDEQKRARDREALLAAAQRNVKARLQDMDKKIQRENGMTTAGSHHQIDWEWKAQAAAQARFDAAHNPNDGKIDLGGGKFMGREEVDEIAAKKVQPLLDEINKNAEREYERRVQAKADEERRKEEEEKNKAREREIQAIHKKLKDQQKGEDKARKAEIKQLEKSHKEQAKAARAEQKRLAKEGKGKEKEIIAVTLEGAEGADSGVGREIDISAPVEEGEVIDDKTRQTKKEESEKNPEKKTEITGGSDTGVGLSRALSIKFHKTQSKHKDPKGKEKEVVPALRDTTTTPAAGDMEGRGGKGEMATSTSSPPPSATTNKVKTWIKSHFQNRSRSKSAPLGGAETADGALSPLPETNSSSGGGDKNRKDNGFIGGVALARLSASSGSSSRVEDAPAAAAAAADTKRLRAETDPAARVGDVSDGDDLEPHRDSMREVALAGREDYLTDPARGVYGKGESSRSAGAGDADVPTPPPAPVPVPIPVVITSSEVSAQPETAVIITNTAVSSTKKTKMDKLVNDDGVSAESTDREDERENRNTKKDPSSILGLKEEEISAVEKFGTEDWDTAPRTRNGVTWTEGRGRSTESVGSLSSTDLSDELDTEDEGERQRDSLEKFEEARAKLDRPEMPPRVSSADVIGMVDDDVGLGGNGRQAGNKNKPLLGRLRPVERGVSPYRGSRFSEDL